MAGSRSLPPHSRLLAGQGGEAETHLGPPFISDTCHTAPTLAPEIDQNAPKIYQHMISQP